MLMCEFTDEKNIHTFVAKIGSGIYGGGMTEMVY